MIILLGQIQKLGQICVLNIHQIQEIPLANRKTSTGLISDRTQHENRVFKSVLKNTLSRSQESK